MLHFNKNKIIPLSSYSKPIRRIIGIDKPVAYAILGNLSSLIFGFVTICLIGKYFSPEIQGYYYAFGSLITIQYFFDFGLGLATIQLASREWPNLSFDRTGRVSGDQDAISKIIGLRKITVRWYGYSALFVIFVLCPGGVYFFLRHSNMVAVWIYPWIAYCVSNAVNLLIMPYFYLMQGCNQLSMYWLYRFIMQIINGITAWGAILAGGGLWTAPITVFTTLLWSLWNLLKVLRVFGRVLFGSLEGPSYSWRRDIWPIQWRIGISWISIYMTTYLFVPIIFDSWGPVAAGQLGMTVSINFILLGISSTWVATKVPVFGSLAAAGKLDHLDNIYFKSLFKSFIVSLSGAIIIMASVEFLYRIGHTFSTRVLPPLPTAFLLSGTIINIITNNFAIYLRAHNRDPLALLFLISSVLIILFSYFFGARYGANGLTGAYLCILAFFHFPLCLKVFLKFKRERSGNNISYKVSTFQK